MLPKKDIPNLLTIARFLAVPGLVAVWYLPPPWGLWMPLALVIFASVTDFLDGYLARRWQVQSELGRLLDPNADKLLIATTLMLLVSGGLASPAAAATILCRELFVSALREFAAERGHVIHVSGLAKWKTAIQMLACITLLSAHCFINEIIAQAGDAFLWLAAALTLITGADYARGLWRVLK